MNKQKKVWTIGSILTWTRQYFGEKGVDNPRLDAEVLLSHILDKDRLHLYVNFDQPLQPAELAAFRDAVKKRVMRIPVAYITGHKEFMGLDFTVAPAVLIPRPDTEILVETALNRLKGAESLRLLDMGIGSGAILISLLVKLPQAQGVGVDISQDALQVAEKNGEHLGVANRLELCRGDLFAPVADREFDAVLSNPPYIPDGDISQLTPEVRREPRLALAGGNDGLDFYRRIIDQGGKLLSSGGFIALEVGVHQAGQVASLAAAGQELVVAAIVKDYAGIERVVVLEKK
ncbi:MAG: peptide chain release factor N(5)-glutamine methyltransferase [Veillonellales bacterium]